MLKQKDQHSTRDAYAAPECKCIEVESDAIICQSDGVSALTVDEVTLEDWGTLI